MFIELRIGRVYDLPPATQDISSLMILGPLDRLKVRKGDGFAHIHGLIEATKCAFALRNAHVSDPAYMAVDVQTWLESSLLDLEAAQICPTLAAPWSFTFKQNDTV